MPASKLTVAGTIQSTAGGFMFPDGTVQTSSAAGALSSVAHDTTLTGNGTTGSPLGVAVPLSLSGSVGFLDPIIMGEDTSNGIGVLGSSSSGDGVFGQSSSGTGVRGIVGTDVPINVPNVGVLGESSSNIGVLGYGRGNAYGVVGESTGTGVGVWGISHNGDMFRGSDGNSTRFRVDNDGDVFAQSYMPISDARVKTNIQPLTEALDKLQQIRGVSFEWTNANPSPAPREIGVIAQEVEAVFPELVKPWGDGGYKGVSYDGLTAVLVEGVKALKVGNDALKAENEALRARLDKLEQMVKELKQTIGK